MPPDFATWQYGPTVYPLVSPGANSLLQDADNALYTTLAYFQSVLSTYMGARLVAEAAKSPAITQVTTAIAQVIPYDPAPFLQQLSAQLPLLALYRVKDTLFEDKTIAWPHRVGEWHVQYILPVLNAGQMERLWPILATVGPILHDRIETMFDPYYQSGAQVWKLAGIESIKLLSADFGRYEAGENLIFPTWKGVLEVKERVAMAAGEIQLFAGVDPAVHLASPIQPQVPDFADSTLTFIDPTTLPGIACAWLPESATVTPGTTNVTAVTCGITGAVLTGTASLQPAQFTDFKGARKPSLRFDGATSSLVGTFAALANDSSRTIVALVRINDTAKRSSILAQTLAGDTGAHSIAIEANTVGTSGSLYGAFAGGTSYDSTYPTTGGGWHVLALQVTATTSAAAIASTLSLSVDGSTPLALTAKNGSGTWSGMSTANQIAIGAIPGITGTNASCDIGPVLAFSATQTPAQLATITAYCKQWAGFT